MIDWSRVDWADVSLHVIVAVLLVIMLQLSPFVGALLVTVIFWIREASQRTMYVNDVKHHLIPWRSRPDGWGWGSQVEAYAPAILAFAVAAIIQFW